MIAVAMHGRRKQPDWETAARFVLAAFRAEAARAGAAERIRDVVGKLSRESAEFAAMWRDDDVRTYGEGTIICAIREPT